MSHNHNKENTIMKYKLSDLKINKYDFDENGLIIYDIENEFTHFLNETAAFIYQCICEKNCDLEQIILLFKENYNMTKITDEVLNDDINEIINSFIEKKLIICYE